MRRRQGGGREHHRQPQLMRHLAAEAPPHTGGGRERGDKLSQIGQAFRRTEQGQVGEDALVVQPAAFEEFLVLVRRRP